MFDTGKVFHSELREMLGGEEPLAAVSCRVAFGADRLERTPEEIERTLRFLPEGVRAEAVRRLRAGPAPADRKAWEKLLDGVSDAVVTGYSGDLFGDPDRLLGGVAASGQAGSWAYRVSRALDAKDLTYAVVSTSRLVVATHDVAGPFAEVLPVPRAAILNARRAGRLLQHGRVVLDFVDLSQVALLTGLFFTGNAKRLVAALASGIVREGG